MDRIRGQITKPVLIGAGVGLILGLIVGLFFAWMVWPVHWVNAPLSDLQPELQSDYLAMAVQSFVQTGDRPAAVQRWNAMGPSKNELLLDLQKNPPKSLKTEDVGMFAAAVNAGVSTAPVANATPTVGAGTVSPTLPAGSAKPTTAPGTKPAAKSSNTLTIVLVLMCILTLAILGLLAYLFFFRNKRGISFPGSRASSAPAVGKAPEQTTYQEGQEPPIVQYLTTYTLGNDLYDDSFSIDSPSGEFLGECGVGISDTIGVGDPKKVTAFEVWLFDKNDIQTVTKVLMSQHAFSDPATNQRLASKGEPVLAEPGKRILLETATLQLEARVVNLNYGQGALPANSFFEQVTLELAVWPKAKPQQ